MNRLFLTLLLFGAVLSVPVCNVPEEEAEYCHRLRRQSSAESRTDSRFSPFELFGWEDVKKDDDF